MNKTLIIIATVISSTSALADNYATCLLDKMPGVQNNPAAWAAVRLCAEAHTGRFSDVEQGAGRGLFAMYDSALECFHDKARTVQSNVAVSHIRSACNRLYDEPEVDWGSGDISIPADPSCRSQNPGPWCQYREQKQGSRSGSHVPDGGGLFDAGFSDIK